MSGTSLGALKGWDTRCRNWDQQKRRAVFRAAVKDAIAAHGYVYEVRSIMQEMIAELEKDHDL